MRTSIAALIPSLLVAIALVNSSDAAKQKLRGFSRDYEARNEISGPPDLVSVVGHGAAATRHSYVHRDEHLQHNRTEESLMDRTEKEDEEGEEEEEHADRELAVAMNMSAVEKANAGYVQSIRKARGLPPLYFSPDLVNEAQRWSRHMKAQGCSASRPSLSLNVLSGWKKIGEVTGRYNSVAVTSDEENEGAILGMIRDPKTRDNLLNACYNRIGVGIVKASDGSYFVTVLTKQV